MRELKITAYQFDELNKEARNRAINDAVQFMVETISYEEASVEMKRAIDEMEKMQTPWFIAETIWDYCKAEVLSFCDNYIYMESGEIVPACAS